ncbi:MAG: indole-3-glycerol phosphate synthase TrpC [Oscillospiraceae bacterium]|nr:indole-3-glycerol phosphate synthase TrpC [Oscillospiraceae bacterium]
MILYEIAEKTRQRVLELKNKRSLSVIKEEAFRLPKGKFLFEKNLSVDEVSFICEVKKASPSKGIIAEDFPYLEIARDYEAAGAAAISVLTEPYWFLGAAHYLTEISEAVNIPVLRKDFTVDEYQIYEAKIIGASAVLLICALLDTDTLREYIKIADSLGLSALVEAHDEEEVHSALDAGARIIGVNNRNLKTFEVNMQTCVNLRKLVPENIIFVAESGIKTREDILALGKIDAVLIGETLMRSADIKVELNALKGIKK